MLAGHKSLGTSAINNIRLKSRKGISCLISIIALCLLTTLAVTISYSAVQDYKMAANSTDILNARYSTESGMQFIEFHLKNVSLPVTTDAQSLAGNLSAALKEKITGTTVSLIEASNTVKIDSIAFDEQHSFEVQIIAFTEGTTVGCEVEITGTSDGIIRRATKRFKLVAGGGGIFNHAVVSKGKIVVGGSGEVVGIDAAVAGSILSLKDDGVAIDLSGSALLSGDAYMTAPDMSFITVKGGGVEVGGESANSSYFDDHVHVGVAPPPFPEIDTDVFKQFVTSYIDSSTDLNATNTYTNVCIKAGTNPSFSSDTVFNGVVYIEYPNKVKFTGQCVVNGVMITERPPVTDLDNYNIEFRGGFTAPGVTALPDTAEFAELKKHDGTVILAPGAYLDFSGNSDSVNGVIAADKIEFGGSTDVGGHNTGPIIGLSDYELTISGNASIRMMQRTDGGVPAGFLVPLTFDAIEGTYQEK